VRIGIYTGDYLRNSRIISFLDEYFLGNCFIYSFLTVSEIYESPTELDLLFLNTNEITHKDLSSIENAIDYPIILLDNKVNTQKNNLTIPLLFNRLNYTKALETVIKNADNIEKLVHFKQEGERVLIPLDNIRYIHSIKRETALYLKSLKTFKENERLGNLCSRIKDDRFLIIHNEYAVNMDYVKVLKGDNALLLDG